jgi:hypothetical protein
MAYGQGGRGGRGRGRYRWMQKATGLPGWMRFGFSPGWQGRSPTGLPPAAEWIMQSGLMPQFMSYLQSTQPDAPSPGMMPQVPFQTDQFTPIQEKQILSQQLEFLENQIEAIRKRLTELEQEEE